MVNDIMAKKEEILDAAKKVAAKAAKKAQEVAEVAAEKAQEVAEELQARAEKVAQRAEVKEAVAAATAAAQKAGKAAKAAAEVMATPSEKNTQVITPEMAKIPAGPLELKWTNYKNHQKLVNPANKRRLDIIVIGTGLAGASAAASLAEMGFNVLNFCIQDSPRRAHSIAAQGGINAAKNYQNDGDSVYRLYYDTIKGGDYRAREANVYRLAEVSNNIIDQCVAQGVPFAREYGGLLDNRSFGGAQVSRTFYAKGQTGQQLLLGAYSALSRQIGKGRNLRHFRRDNRRGSLFHSLRYFVYRSFCYTQCSLSSLYGYFLSCLNRSLFDLFFLCCHSRNFLEHSDTHAKVIQYNDSERQNREGSDDAADHFDTLHPNEVVPTERVESRPNTVVQVEPECAEPDEVEHAVHLSPDGLSEECLHVRCSVLRIESTGLNTRYFRELHLKPEVVEVQAEETENAETENEHVLRLPIHAFFLTCYGITVVTARCTVLDRQVERVAEMHQHQKGQTKCADEGIPVCA